MKKRYLGMWIWLYEDKLKVKVAHFWLPSASQKRACLSSPKNRDQTLSPYGPVSRRSAFSLLMSCASRLTCAWWKSHENFFRSTDDNDLTRKMGITKQLMQRSGLRLLACYVRFQNCLNLRFFFNNCWILSWETCQRPQLLWILCKNFQSYKLVLSRIRAMRRNLVDVKF